MSPLADTQTGFDHHQALDDFWQRWKDGVNNRQSLFHTPTVSTASLQGVPNLRTVVLRQATREERSFRFHTDRRSSKFEDLKANPAISLHVYDREAAVQLRVWGQASIHTDDAYSDTAWDESREMSRLCYGSKSGPGKVIETPFSAPTKIDQGFARDNFAAIRIIAERLEWLHLRAKGHQRVGFTWTGASWQGQWLAP